MVKPLSRRLGLLALAACLAAAAFAIVWFVRNGSAAARAKKLKNPIPATAPALAAGKQSYVQHCQKCHGEKGNGQGEKAVELSVAPSDFTNAREMGELADGQIFQEITEGDLPMPAFADKLTEQERWQIVDYIRTFAPTTASAH